MEHSPLFVHSPRYLGARKKSRAYQLFMFLKILRLATRIYPESQVPCRVPWILSAAFAASLNMQAARGRGGGSVLEEQCFDFLKMRCSRAQHTLGTREQEPRRRGGKHFCMHQGAKGCQTQTRTTRTPSERRGLG